MHIRKGSPAEEVGVKVEDILVKINGLYAYNFSLEENGDEIVIKVEMN